MIDFSTGEIFSAKLAHNPQLRRFGGVLFRAQADMDEMKDQLVAIDNDGIDTGRTEVCQTLIGLIRARDVAIQCVKRARDSEEYIVIYSYIYIVIYIFIIYSLREAKTLISLKMYTDKIDIK